MYPNSLKNLIESFKMLPGIGEKTAERMAFFVLNMDEENIDFFSESLKNAYTGLHKCPKCNNITDLEECNICSAENRDLKQLCIVDDVRTLYMFEKSNIYKGLYYVIDNLISPISGINPEDIGLEKLLKFIDSNNFDEVIIAIKSNIEGETTSLYIRRILDGIGLKITRLASGIPLGADMEYIDSLTLEKAMIDRREIE